MKPLHELYLALDALAEPKKSALQQQDLEKAAELRSREKRLLEEIGEEERRQGLMLSKSSLMLARQCPKALWLYKRKYRQLHVDEESLKLLRQGNVLGEKARALFPGGVLVVPEGSRPDTTAAQRTLQLISEGVQTLYEATFICNNVLVAVDILTRQNDAWTVYEVKGSHSVGQHHILDAAIQAHILSHILGEELGPIFILHLSLGALPLHQRELHQQLKAVEVTAEVEALQKEIPLMIRSGRQVLLGPEPDLPIGAQCTSPYPCGFRRYCGQMT